MKISSFLKNHSSKRRPWWQTLYGRVALLLILAVCLFSSYQLISLTRSFRDAVNRADQLSSLPLAKTLAARLEPLLRNANDEWELRKTVSAFVEANPRISAFLLGERGELLFDFSGDFDKTRANINLNPVLELLRGYEAGELPIFGDDPEDSRGIVIFAADRVTVEGKPAYLYLSLNSKKFRMTTQLEPVNSLRRIGLRISLIGVLAVTAVSLFVLYFLSRRFSWLSSVAADFREGNYARRFGLEAFDDVGDLGAAIDEMANRIAGTRGELAERDDLRRQLVTSISHDLRRPIKAVSGYLEQMRTARSSGKPETRTEAFQTVRQDAGTLTQILAQLTELEQLEAKHAAPAIEDVDARDLLEDAAGKYASRARDLEIALGCALPQGALLVRGDGRMLNKALTNLVEIALRFTPAGGQVTLSAREEGERFVRIAVADTGPGVADENVEKIFDKFYRASTPERFQGGSCGIGLTILRRVVELHGSDVFLQSSLQHGTEFSFLLPRVAAPPLPVETPAPVQEEPPAEPPSEPLVEPLAEPIVESQTEAPAVPVVEPLGEPLAEPSAEPPKDPPSD